MRRGPTELRQYLDDVQALPLRGYVPYTDGRALYKPSCLGHMERSEPDDDINYSVLALGLLEQHGAALTTVDVARAWLQLLPLGMVFTAERAAYVTLANHAATFFAQGQDPRFDLSLCSDNGYNHWIGAQIRADVYGWVLPGNPAEAARGSIAGRDDAVEALHARFGHLSPVHTINNLALVVWALLTNPDDLGAAVGDAVAAGWDTDCNGATVGGLWGITGQPVPEEWTAPWASRVAVSLAGHDELPLESLIDRTVAVGERLADR